jgi:hypothetical protein
MPINDWIVDGEQTKRITAIFRPRRGLEDKLLQAIDAAEKRDPCRGYLVVDVPPSFLETTQRRYFNPDDLMKAESEGTAKYKLGREFEYFVRIPLNEKGAQTNLVEALKKEDNTRVGLRFADSLLRNPEKLTKDRVHFLTIRRYSDERPDILEIYLVQSRTKNTEVFKRRIEKVNQYVNRIFRALDEKGLVKYD